jgi:hypothetical protein
MPTASRNTPPVRRLAVALLAATALAVSACGTQATFVNDYNEATKPLERINTELVASTTASDPAANERSFDRLSTELHAVARRLRTLQPPKEAQDELNHLVASLDTTADGAHASVAAMRSGSPRRIARAVKRFTGSAVKLVAADQALKTAIEA